jgi:hypothetical protein
LETRSVIISSAEDILHLHGLDDGDGFAGLDLLADGDRDGDDEAGTVPARLARRCPSASSLHTRTPL